MIHRECPCGQVFTTTLIRLETGRGRYCSKACLYVYRKRPSGLTYKIVAENRGWFPKGAQHPTGSASHAWKGDRVGYQELHRWVRQNKVKPDRCEHCDEETQLEWANRSHEYLRDLDDWLALCRWCHRHYDRESRGAAVRKYGARGLRGYAS